MINTISNVVSRYGVPIFFIALFIYKLPDMVKAYRTWKKGFDIEEEKKEGEKEDA